MFLGRRGRYIQSMFCSAISLRGTLASALVALCACVSPPPLAESVPARPRHELPSRPQGEIIVCGQRVPVDAPVLLWTEAPHYDAYSSTHRFQPKAGRVLAEEGPRLLEGRAARGELPELTAGSDDLKLLKQHVTQFVIHYDVCASSRRCFAAFPGRVGRRHFGGIAAWRIRPASRSRASSRLRSWLRNRLAVITTTPSRVIRRPARGFSRR